MQNQEIPNRLWLDFYKKHIVKTTDLEYAKFDEYFLCPCCYFPTLTAPGAYNLCLLCDWEDDGQADHNADEILGGPNSDYSLTEARENFKKHLTSYRLANIIAIEQSPDIKTFAELTEIKKQIIENYNLIMFETNLIDRTKAILENDNLKKTLYE